MGGSAGGEQLVLAALHAKRHTTRCADHNESQSDFWRHVRSIIFAVAWRVLWQTGVLRQAPSNF